MTHRAHPDADRARRQVQRHQVEHHPAAPPRPLSPLETQAVAAVTALSTAFAPIKAAAVQDMYRLAAASRRT